MVPPRSSKSSGVLQWNRLVCPPLTTRPTHGKMSAPRRQPGSEDMGLDMVRVDERHFERQGQHLRRADADQKRTDQPRRIHDDDAADVGELEAGLPQRFIHRRQQSLQVGPGRDFRNDAAEAGVQIDLRGDDVGAGSRNSSVKIATDVSSQEVSIARKLIIAKRQDS